MLKPENEEDYFLYIAGIIIILLIVGSCVPSLNYLVNLGFSGLLLFVTIKYTSLTKDILEDGSKNREIEFLQRQLEYFYCPLLHIIEKAQLAIKEVYYTKENNINYLKCLSTMCPILNENYKEIYRYKYLTNGDIKEKLPKIENYLHHMEGVIKNSQGVIGLGHDNDDYSYIYGHQEEIFQELVDFKDQLESEIEGINSKLINLIK